MSARETIRRARSAGVELWKEGGRLRYRAPANALTPALRESLAADKARVLEQLEAERDLAALFDERAAVREYDGGYSRADAEPLATLDTIALYFDAEVIDGPWPAALSLAEEQAAIAAYARRTR